MKVLIIIALSIAAVHSKSLPWSEQDAAAIIKAFNQEFGDGQLDSIKAQLEEFLDENFQAKFEQLTTESMTTATEFEQTTATEADETTATESEQTTETESEQTTATELDETTATESEQEQQETTATESVQLTTGEVEETTTSVSEETSASMEFLDDASTAML